MTIVSSTVVSQIDNITYTISSSLTNQTYIVGSPALNYIISPYFTVTDSNGLTCSDSNMLTYTSSGNPSFITFNSGGPNSPGFTINTGSNSNIGNYTVNVTATLING